MIYTKYHNKKTVIDNIEFASKAEANKYCELKLLKKAGEVKSFKLQPKFMVWPAFEKDGKKYRPIYYIADFDVVYADGTREIIDVKSPYTLNLATFRLKQKLFDSKYPKLTLVVES